MSIFIIQARIGTLYPYYRYDYIVPVAVTFWSFYPYLFVLCSKAVYSQNIEVEVHYCTAHTYIMTERFRPLLFRQALAIYYY